ncbi:unnamed protein product [Phaeothamnion confervicola]
MASSTPGPQGRPLRAAGRRVHHGSPDVRVFEAGSTTGQYRQLSPASRRELRFTNAPEGTLERQQEASEAQPVASEVIEGLSAEANKFLDFMFPPGSKGAVDCHLPEYAFAVGKKGTPNREDGGIFIGGQTFKSMVDAEEQIAGEMEKYWPAILYEMKFNGRKKNSRVGRCERAAAKGSVKGAASKRSQQFAAPASASAAGPVSVSDDGGVDGSESDASMSNASAAGDGNESDASHASSAVSNAGGDGNEKGASRASSATVSNAGNADGGPLAKLGRSKKVGCRFQINLSERKGKGARARPFFLAQRFESEVPVSPLPR